MLIVIVILIIIIIIIIIIIMIVCAFQVFSSRCCRVQTLFYLWSVLRDGASPRLLNELNGLGVYAVAWKLRMLEATSIIIIIFFAQHNKETLRSYGG